MAGPPVGALVILIATDRRGALSGCVDRDAVAGRQHPTRAVTPEKSSRALVPFTYDLSGPEPARRGLTQGSGRSPAGRTSGVGS